MSFSLQIYHRMNAYKTRRHVLGIIYILLIIAYIAWRTTVFSEHSLFLSWVFFIATVLGGMLDSMTIINTWTYSYREPLPTPRGLDIDVFIPTYKEPIDIIEQTVRAAVGIDYPHRTLVLDDAHRDEVKTVADKAGALYFSRDKNINAKAGNLNFGLTKSTAEFFAVFDVDHVPQREALDKLLGYFKDKDVALVQSPQVFYNVDAIPFINAENNKRLCDDQSIFYGLIQQGSDHYDVTLCVGTGLVYRRKAIDAIGGIPEQTVTEDVHTSLKLNKRGWKTRCFNEPVAYGISACDLDEYYKTRYRWAHGNLGVLKHENIFFCKGLSLRQRLFYLNMGYIYFAGWQQLLLYLTPVLTLFFGLQPFSINVFNVLIILFFPVLSALILREVTCGFARFWANEIFSIMRLPIDLIAVRGLLNLPLAWHSSTKRLKGRVSLYLILPQLILAVLSALALCYGIWRLYPDFKVGPLFQALTHPSLETMFMSFDKADYVVDLVCIAGFWVIFNITKAIFFINKSYKQARNSAVDYQFFMALPLQIVLGDTKASIITVSSRISLSKMLFLLPSNKMDRLDFSRSWNVKLFLPAGEICCQLKTIKIVGKAKGADKNNLICEAQLFFEDEQVKDRLRQTLFSFCWHRPLYHPVGYGRMPSEVISRIIRLKNPLTTSLSRHNPVLIKRIGDQPIKPRMAIIIASSPYSRPVQHRLLCFQTFKRGEHLTLDVLFGGNCFTKRIQIIGEASDSDGPLMKKNLDGTRTLQYVVSYVE